MKITRNSQWRVLHQFIKKFLACTAIAIIVSQVALAMEAPKTDRKIIPLNLTAEIWFKEIIPNLSLTKDVINMGCVSRFFYHSMCTLGEPWQEFVKCGDGDVVPPKFRREILMLLLEYHPIDVIKNTLPTYRSIFKISKIHPVVSLKEVVKNVYYNMLRDLEEMGPFDAQQQLLLQGRFKELLTWDHETDDDGITKKSKEKCIIQ